MVNEKWMDKLAEQDRSSRGKLGIGQIKTNRVVFKQTLTMEKVMNTACHSAPFVTAYSAQTYSLCAKEILHPKFKKKKKITYFLLTTMSIEAVVTST